MKFKKDQDEKPEGTRTVKDILKMAEITPLKDFPNGIHHNQWDIDIKEGVPVAIPRKFLQNMVTEGIIAKLPKEG